MGIYLERLLLREVVTGLALEGDGGRGHDDEGEMWMLVGMYDVVDNEEADGIMQQKLL